MVDLSQLIHKLKKTRDAYLYQCKRHGDHAEAEVRDGEVCNEHVPEDNNYDSVNNNKYDDDDQNHDEHNGP